MYKNRNSNGKLNLCGEKIQLLRKQMTPKVSQRALADKLQLAGIDLDKNAIQRIESGQRFVTDIELRAFAKIFQVTTDFLLENHFYKLPSGPRDILSAADSVRLSYRQGGFPERSQASFNFCFPAFPFLKARGCRTKFR